MQYLVLYNIIFMADGKQPGCQITCVIRLCFHSLHIIVWALSLWCDKFTCSVIFAYIALSCKVEQYSRYTKNSISPNFGTLQDFLVAEFNALSRGNVLNFVSSTYFFENLKFVKKFLTSKEGNILKRNARRFFSCPVIGISLWPHWTICFWLVFWQLSEFVSQCLAKKKFRFSIFLFI